MKLTASAEIDASAEIAFARMSDFDGFLGVLTDQGTFLQRRNAPDPITVGTTWSGQLDIRGAVRDIDVELTGLERPRFYELAAHGGGLQATMRVDVIAEGADASRALVAIDLTPVSLAGRIVLQSVKVMHRKLEKRLRSRLRRFARYITE
ncbi:SRPBCC family protein [Qingshengfaniella alkalisoli]|uniref:SRPBCC family protein n=1 Tax=Qingshengfaniella alkalisoli TaxID=2599296 RepID=UPI00143D93BE|nr:SRPBCC family protein [Qingshengfaniella alkalisoli]